ncbi:ROK family protein [Phycicoccus sp. CSK15P-2]|uniref:ROK family protein n=1 Tax=Phycicoccus sp. CSK15P-2 TaxID=2807627 RepID=UPI001951A79D|nr:ROK family protein [Phycicoccus sp. CSK15P-2]MBM6404894.1 ROK family protein [Phycicoccus sp. CSK15P-2]
MRLGIDIGGTKTAALVLGEDGAVLTHASSPSGKGPTETLATAVAVADEVASAVGGWGAVTSVGACMPGLVDPGSGVVRHAVNLDVATLDLAGGIQAATGRRPSVDNDVKAAALGAHHVVRPGTGAATTAYLNVGTGLAAAIVHDGSVIRGAGGAAGEIGHLPVGSGEPCSCGQTGCLETVASGRALSRMWSRPAAELFPAAEQGDEAACRVVATLAHGIALAVQVLVLAGAELIVVGGGLTRDASALGSAVRSDIEERAATSPFLARLGLATRFRLLDHETPVAAVGAALLPPPVTADLATA